MSFDAFCALIDDTTRHTERECQQYVGDIAEKLFEQTPESFVTIRLEQRSFYGSSDFIVAANIRTATGLQRHVRFWELKAPQSLLMKWDGNNNRYGPSDDLVKAENQLIQYVYLAQRDGAFHSRYSTYGDFVRPGGVIIGRNEKLINSSNPQEIEAAAESLKIRGIMMYEAMNIKLYTWDHVKYLLKPPEPITGLAGT